MKRIVEEIINNLNPREREIVLRRHGLKEGESETLESIGKDLGITRERVRQIQNHALEKIKPLINSHPEINNLLKESKNFLNPVGALEENYFYQILIKNKVIKEGEEKIFRFFSIYSKQIVYYFGDEFLRSFFATKEETFLFIKHILKKLYFHFLENHQKLFSEDEIFDLVYKELKTHIFQKIKFEDLLGFLKIIRHLYKNPFAHWGFAKNSYIVPTCLKHKIYIILKQENKPLHFSEIHRKLNQILEIEDEFLHPNWKRTYSEESIKNELIRHPEFVLVGRGTYGLKEWGIKEGYIIDVLKNFILENKEIPLKKIYEFINSQRIVKPTTLSIYLYRLQKEGLIKIEGNVIKLIKK